LSGLWTLGILILAGAFALLLFLNPNLSWTVKRLPRAVYPLFSRRKQPKDLETEDYDFHLNSDRLALQTQDKETSP